MHDDPLAKAALAAADGGAPEMTFRVGPDAAIRLDDTRDSSGHLLAGATITEWADQ